MRKFLFVLVLLNIFQLQAQQWERMPGPVGTEVTSVVKFNGLIYAGTYSGVFFSSDQGVSWQPDLDGMDGGMYIWSMATNGDTLIAATSVGVFYKTPGNPWQISQMLNIMMKVVSNGDVFLAKAYSNFQVYRSTDGITWQSTGHATGAIGTSGNMFFLDTTADILRSGDGLSWTGINENLPGFGVSAISGDGNVMFVSRFEGGIYRSTDNGTTLTPVTFPTGSTFAYRAHNFAFNGTTVYANVFSEIDEIYFSTDYGLTWQKRNPGAYPSVFGWGGMIAEDDYQLVASYEGIYRSTDGGANWTFGVSNGLANSTVLGLLQNQGKVHALTGFDLGGSFGVYSTENPSQDWAAAAPQHFGRNGNARFGTVVNNALLVLNGFTLSRSTDNGLSWTNILTAPDNITALFTSGNRVIMATNFNKIHYSDDSGSTWIEAPSANPIVNCITSHNGVLFAGTSSGVQKSTNNGATWTNLPPLMAGSYDVMNLVANDSYLFAAVQSGGAYIQLYRSGDNGQTWTNIQGSLPQGYWSTIAANGSTLLVGTNPVGADFDASYLYRSLDNGSNWELYEPGMFVESDITYLGFFDNKWWAGTESAGLWSIGSEVLSNPQNQFANELQVWPNPTHGRLHLKLNSNAEFPTIAISDITGRSVSGWSQSLDSGNMVLDISSLQQSVYIVKVVLDGKSSSIKIVKQ